MSPSIINNCGDSYSPAAPFYHNLLLRIESIKTTSMEDVSTRVLEKIKNI